MENTPLAPRQRNRRADRQSAQEPPLQQGYTPQPQAPVQPLPQGYARQTQPPVQQGYMPQQQLPVQTVQPLAQTQPMAPTQPVQQSYAPRQQLPVQTVQPLAQTQPMAPTQPVQQSYAPRQQLPQQGYMRQQSYPQSPMNMYQQPVQPQRPGSYPPSGVQQPLQPQPQVQCAPRTAAPREPMTVPQARATRSLDRELARDAKLARREAEKQARQEAQAEKQKQAAEKPDAKPKKAVPGWLSTALSLSIIAVLAMVAAYYLMQAYLVTEENKRIAAYEATLNNYHVTEAADGTLHVTWQDEIEKYAAQYNLQPAFVMAIIRNESSFRTNAESDVGARGLMQLMPDTAEWIAGKLDDDSYTFDRMWDAETNIRYGCWYLGYLTRLFRGDAQLVSAAYHAGQTTVTQWLSDPERSSDGVTLDMDRLTDGPTKQYIGRVTQTYGIYQSLLYPDEAFGTSDAVPALSGTAASPAR